MGIKGLKRYMRFNPFYVIEYFMVFIKNGIQLNNNESLKTTKNKIKLILNNYRGLVLNNKKNL